MNKGIAVCSLIILLAMTAMVLGQDSWLDKKPIENWNKKGMPIPAGPKYDPEELERCGHTIRPATLVADKVVENRGWKLINEAHVWGGVSIVTVTRGFDGQCRPYEYQSMVFVDNRLIGTLSPKLMISRTDGAISSIELWNKDALRVEYSRYKDSDALCCPSNVEAVFFSIDHGQDGSELLVPGDSYLVNEEPESTDSTGLAGTKWKWEMTETPTGNITAGAPEKYTLEFLSEGRAAILADCNRGSGSFKLDGSSLTFTPFAVTKMACPAGSQDNKFLTDLGYVRIFRREGEKLYLDLFADGGTMVFTKVN